MSFLDRVTGFLDDRERVARILFVLGALEGISGVAAGALYGAALASGDPTATFLTVFVPLSALWALFTYLAYRGLASRNPLLAFVFWSFVVFNFFVFPVGTLVAGASVWIRRELGPGR